MKGLNIERCWNIEISNDCKELGMSINTEYVVENLKIIKKVLDIIWWKMYNKYCSWYGGCGEVVNASDCGSDIRGFDSPQPPH